MKNAIAKKKIGGRLKKNVLPMKLALSAKLKEIDLGMKKKPELRKDSFHTVMNSVSGIQRISVPNSGIYSTGKKIPASISGYFQ